MIEPALPKLRKFKSRRVSIHDMPIDSASPTSIPLFEEHDYSATEWLAAQRLHLLRTLLSLAHPLWKRIDERTGRLDAPLAETTYKQAADNISALRAASGQGGKLVTSNWSSETERTSSL